MLSWALMFFVLALVAGVLGFSGLAGAFANALERAEWIAGAAGRANPVVESIEDNGTPSFAMARGKSAFMADSAPSFDLDPEDVEVSATLSVKFSTD